MMTIPSAPRLYQDLPPSGAERSGMREEKRERARLNKVSFGDHVFDLQIPTHFHEFGLLAR